MGKRAIRSGRKAGRPEKYATHVAPRFEEIGWWCRDGLIEVEIAKRLGVSYRAFCDYKIKYPQLVQVLKENKEIADYRVEDSLNKRANGFTYTEITQDYAYDESGKRKLISTRRTRKFVPPETAAAIFWLKNRRSSNWRNSDTPPDPDNGQLDQLVNAINSSVERQTRARKASDNPGDKPDDMG